VFGLRGHELLLVLDDQIVICHQFFGEGALDAAAHALELALHPLELGVAGVDCLLQTKPKVNKEGYDFGRLT